jgi:hypothetical protein
MCFGGIITLSFGKHPKRNLFIMFWVAFRKWHFPCFELFSKTSKTTFSSFEFCVHCAFIILFWDFKRFPDCSTLQLYAIWNFSKVKFKTSSKPTREQNQNIPISLTPKNWLPQSPNNFKGVNFVLQRGVLG